MNINHQEKVWVVQRCIDAWSNHYENWPGYFEIPMIRDEMMQALDECHKKWPEHEFRGHNITHESIRCEKGEYPKII